MTDWEGHLAIARKAAKMAAHAIRSDFGFRKISEYKGYLDVQLRADLVAQEVILECLSEAYPDYGLVGEEGTSADWSEEERVWVIDPLDGSNNFGYGIAHCSISITLLSGQSVVLAVVLDPILGREFFATTQRGFTHLAAPYVPLSRATISLVSNYSEEGRVDGLRIDEQLSPHCRRILSLWSPSLDLALVATGALDAVVCHKGSFLDVCGGAFLVGLAGGCLVDLEGKPIVVHRAMHYHPVSFIAAGGADLAQELLDAFRESGERVP